MIYGRVDIHSTFFSSDHVRNFLVLNLRIHKVLSLSSLICEVNLNLRNLHLKKSFSLQYLHLVFLIFCGINIKCFKSTLFSFIGWLILIPSKMSSPGKL